MSRGKFSSAVTLVIKRANQHSEYLIIVSDSHDTADAVSIIISSFESPAYIIVYILNYFKLIVYNNNWLTEELGVSRR